MVLSADAQVLRLEVSSDTIGINSAVSGTYCRRVEEDKCM